jgi:transcriptional regulator of acetoin/glycerol metabolism
MARKDVLSHIDSVHESVLGRSAATPKDPRLVRSWERSLEAYQLDPARSAQPRILTGSRLREHQEPMEDFLRVAHRGVSRLHSQVREADYVVLLTDADGVTIDFLGDPRLERELKQAGLYLGSCWSEQEEGTCGVGTCIADGQRITVHRSEHFRAPNIQLTCSAAPILDTQGRLLAVLDASALTSPEDKRSQHLAFQVVSQTARLIENAHFLNAFNGQWLLHLAPAREFLDVHPDYLIALEGDGRVAGVNRAAREDLFDGRDPSGRACEQIFDAKLEALAAAAHRVATPLRIFRRGRPQHLYGRLRPPRASSRTLDIRAETAREPSSPLDAWAGSDPAAKALTTLALRLLQRKVPLLLQGETGAGKERFAQALHATGPRAGKPFVALNCAAIPETLIESELFGYRDGAFTGARAKGMKGRILQADGGTLFLDEIGDMPLALQSRLLRALSEYEVTPLGSEVPLRVDLQVICASHQDLRGMVTEGRFREDLYYRLAGATLRLPTLSERADLDGLIHGVLAEITAGDPQPVIDRAAMRALRGHRWPGNLRELHSALRYAVAICDGQTIQLADLPEDLIEATSNADDDERSLIERTLADNAGSVVDSARALGISRATLYRRLGRLGLSRHPRGFGA